MKIFRLSLFLALIYLFQVIVVSRFTILGVRADLPLIITTLYAVSFGAEKGFIIGAVFGFIQDIFGGSFYFHVISRGLLGFLVGTFKESVLGTEQTVALTAVFVATVTNFIFELLLLVFFFGKPLATVSALISSLAISCLFNSVLAPLFYPLVRNSSQYFLMEQ